MTVTTSESKAAQNHGGAPVLSECEQRGDFFREP
jgi:hypothetical protein